MLLLLISVGITVFLIVAALMLLLSGKDAVDARLMEISAPPPPISPVIVETPTSGLARAAVGITSIFKPIRGIVSGSDEDLAYRLTLAGFRKAEHVEIFAATKMLLPVAAIVAGSFFGDNMRSEEHTSELQSRPHIVCRLLLEKKKKVQSRRPSDVSGRRCPRATARRAALLTPTIPA